MHETLEAALNEFGITDVANKVVKPVDNVIGVESVDVKEGEKEEKEEKSKHNKAIKLDFFTLLMLRNFEENFLHSCCEIVKKIFLLLIIRTSHVVPITLIKSYLLYKKLY